MMLPLFLILILHQDPQASEIRSLIEQLRSEKADERDQASRKLKSLGKVCVPQLEPAARHPDPEMSQRASHLLRVIALAEGLSPSVRKTFPGIEERLVAADLQPWTEEFLQICAEAGPGKRYAMLQPDDFRGLVGPAVRGAQADWQKDIICQRADILRFGAAGEELTPLLRDRSPDIRQQVLRTFRSLQIRKIAPEVIPLLKDESPRVRCEAVQTLGLLGIAETASSIVPLLKDPDVDIRQQAVVALGKLEVREAIPEIVLRLRDEVQFVRGTAAAVLAAMDAREAIGEIAPLLRDPEERVRLRAAAALCVLGSREGVPMVLDAAAKDKNVVFGLLNHLRCPAGAKRLRGAKYRWPFPGKKDVPAEEFIRAVSGIELDVTKVPNGKIDLPSVPAIQDRWPNAGGAVEDILALAGLSYFLEEDRIVLLPREEALRAWKEWFERSTVPKK